MRVFLINMAESVDRLRFMDTQLQRLGIQYDRVQAINGRRMDGKELRRTVSRFHSLCAMGRRLNLGEIGCALSHCSIYRRMMKESIPCALVLEDDVVIDERINDVIEEILRCVDVSRPQVYILSGGHAEKAKDVSIEKLRNAMYADGYVITITAAKLICNANTPVITVADQWRRWVRWNGLELYCCHPSVIRQNRDSYNSTIALSYRASSNIVIAIFWKAIRLLGLIIDRLICIVK